MKRHALLVGLLLASSAASPAAMAQTSPPTYVQPLTPAAIRLVQDHLRQAGAYTGRVDGIWGDDSQSALEHFQQTHGLQVTGQLNQVTVTALGLAPSDLLATGPSPAPGTVGAATSPAPLASPGPDAIRAVQNRLRQLNFYSGGVDGIWGAETQAAIEHFQQGRGLQANGQLNPATISALGMDPNILVPQTSR